MAKGSRSGSGSSAPLIGSSLAGGFLSQGAGIGAIGCKPEDNSFYCRFSRFVMILKNALFVALILVFLVFLFRNRKKLFS